MIVILRIDEKKKGIKHTYIRIRPSGEVSNGEKKREDKLSYACNYHVKKRINNVIWLSDSSHLFKQKKEKKKKRKEKHIKRFKIKIKFRSPSNFI